jgi:uncharacterized protein YicC (UPF0701 family)
MSKVKDLRKQMKKQLKEFEEQIETFGEQADAVEAATLKRAQERLVNLVDAMDAQLKVWQNGMSETSIKLHCNKPNSATANINPEITSATVALWNSMEKQIQQWLTTTATMRMEVGADALWQLETLRALNSTANEKLRTLKNAQNGERAVLKVNAEQALDDLKHALEHVLPE